MPELPEVETVVRDLRPLVIGRTIATLRFSKHRLRRQGPRARMKLLRGTSVESISRRGKWIVLALDNGARLVVHLGMTGQLKVMNVAKPVESHTHLLIDFEGGDSQLRFRDIRRFGSLTAFGDEAAVQEFFRAAGLGPEPFELQREYWRGQLGKTRRCMKAVLLDQRVVAGVGNIYADESLFQARIHPTRIGREVRASEAESLRKAIVRVLRRAIDHRGSSIRDYVGGSGLRGRFQDEFCVYGRTGKACIRCRSEVQCIRLAGRATHFCGNCQKEG